MHKTKFIFLILILFFSNISFAASSYDVKNQTYLEKIKQAQTYESQGNIKNANEYYYSAEEIFPERFESSFGLAKTYTWLGYHKEAEKYYKILQKKYPNHLDVMEQYAYFLTYTGNHRKAIKLFGELFEQTKKAKFLIGQAEATLYTGQANESLKILQSLTRSQLQTNNYKGVKLLGDSYFNLGCYKQAAAVYLEYLKFQKSTEIEIKLAKSYIEIGCPKNAECILLQYPDDKSALEILGQMYINLNEHEKAYQIYEKLAQFDNGEQSKIKCAECQIAMGNYEKSSAILEGMSVENPKNKDLKCQLCRSYIASGQYDKASAYVSELEKIKDKDPALYELLVDYYKNTNNYDKSVAYLQEMHERYPNEETLMRIGDMYMNMNQAQRAEDIFQRMLSSNNFQDRAGVTLSRIYMDKGKFRKSEKLLKKLTKDPNNIAARKNLAQMYYYQQDYLTSIKLLEGIENDEEVRVLLAKNYYGLSKDSYALSLLNSCDCNEAKILKAKIERSERLNISPIYGFESRRTENNDLNLRLFMQRYGVSASRGITPDIDAYAKFQAVDYRSRGRIVDGTVYYYTLGSSGKIKLKTDYIAEATLATFPYDGLEVFGRAYATHRVNDKFSVYAGYLRSLVEESIMSTIGIKPTVGPYAGQVVGRIIDDKWQTGFSLKLPFSSYLYGGFNIGFKGGKNSSSNLYEEFIGGIGKVVYAKEETRPLSLATIGYNLFVANYEKDMLNFGGASLYGHPIGSDGGNPANVGGYFSPSGFFSNSINVKIKGAFPKLKLTYENEAYMGVQNYSVAGSDFIWGNRIQTTWNEEGKVGVRLGYNTNYWGVARQNAFFVQLLINDVMNLFKKQKES